MFSISRHIKKQIKAQSSKHKMSSSVATTAVAVPVPIEIASTGIQLIESCIIKYVNEIVSKCPVDSENKINVTELVKLFEENKIKLVKAKKEGKKNKGNKISIPLPFIKKNDENCVVIKPNSGLYTQCENVKIAGSNFCAKCAEASNTLKHGTIENRDSPDWVDGNGKKPEHYVKILQKKKITVEEAKAEILKYELDIPDSIFEGYNPVKRGRTKKIKSGEMEQDGVTSDAPVAPKQKRQKTTTPVVESQENSDMLKQLRGESTTSAKDEEKEGGEGVKMDEDDKFKDDSVEFDHGQADNDDLGNIEFAELDDLDAKSESESSDSDSSDDDDETDDEEEIEKEKEKRKKEEEEAEKLRLEQERIAKEKEAEDAKKKASKKSSKKTVIAK